MSSNKRLFNMRGSIAAIVLMFAASAIHAEAKLELETTEITGARELPKVLYIVPWKNTEPDPRPLPMRSLVDEALAPVDMDVFRRQVHYHQLLNSVEKP